jgi:hypothetical protein
MAKKSLILILSLALMLRLINLGQSLWLDEAAQAEMSTKSVSYIWDGRGGDFHPPLYSGYSWAKVKFGYGFRQLFSVYLLFM